VIEPLRVLLATGNAGKVREFGRLLGPRLSVEGLPPETALPEETGRTFAANARLKAEAVADALGRTVAVLADDSGLEVAALGGRPGIRSARFAGDDARDEDNLRKLLAELAGRVDRSARFVCALCLVLPTAGGDRGAGRSIEVEGVLAGDVTLAPRGDNGFGYDPVFRPRGRSATLAEAAPEDKDSISHRGQACRKLLACLAGLGIVQGEGRAKHGP
jgi:XTP/dITP diphosphohydrolase